MMIKMYAFLSDVASKQKENLVILYDEPETFLHPKWQQQFPVLFRQVVEDIFGITNSHIIITTHSPLVIMNAQKLEFADVEVIKINIEKDGGRSTEHITDVSGYCVEQLMLDQFDVSYRKQSPEELLKSVSDPAESIHRASDIKNKITKLYNDIMQDEIHK